VKKPTKKDIRKGLTPRQALEDAMVLIKAKQKELGCGPRGSPTYCPVMTVGGSYAGMLSTLARLNYPDIVDMAYSGSPCLLLFDHQSDPHTYFDYITEVAERMSPGCTDAVRGALAKIQSDMKPAKSKKALKAVAKEYGVCPKLPGHIKTGADLAAAIASYTASGFANTNMDYYPPSPEQKFYKGCKIFQNEHQPVNERLRDYFELISESPTKGKCHDFNPTPKDKAQVWGWNALCCELVQMLDRSAHSMWPPYNYSLAQDTYYCERDYGITPDPTYIDREYGLNDLTNVTRLLMTNGYNDGWYPTSYTEPIKGCDAVIMNFENGAHHSDLTHQLQPDTPDIAQGHLDISNLIGQWLAEVKGES
jgi:hypothetical protein